MKSIEFLYSFLLCVMFFYLNYKKIGLKNKSALLPSTVFALMWGITSLGGFLFRNGLAYDEDVYITYYLTATNLDEISVYQFHILIVIFTAFLLARFNNQSLKFADFDSINNSININKTTKDFRWILVLFFIIGILRLIIVVNLVGFNYAAIRNLYITGRDSFSMFDIWLVRIGSYLMRATVFYIALLGIEAAMHGIDIKKTIKNFALFAPFQMSFGGRLFILSFFVPFFLSYFIVSFLSKTKMSAAERSKLTTIGTAGFGLVVLLAILKQGINVDIATLISYTSEIFYTAASYHYMNEFWAYLPTSVDLGYGQNILGMGSSIVNDIHNAWITTGNNAIMMTPSMIPDVFMDFGKTGSLIFFFFLFYLIESIAMKLMRYPDIINILIYMLLCYFCFSTPGSSMGDCIKALFISYILVIILKKYFVTKI